MKKYALLVLVVLAAFFYCQTPTLAEPAQDSYVHIPGGSFSDSYCWNAAHTDRGNYWYTDSEDMLTRRPFGSLTEGDWIEYDQLGGTGSLVVNAVPYEFGHPNVKVMVNGAVVGAMNLYDPSPEMNDGEVHIRAYQFDVGGSIETVRLEDDTIGAGFGRTILIDSLDVWVPFNSVYAKDFSTSNGWLYNESGVQPDGGVAEYLNTSIGGSAYNMESAGHFTVPEGAAVRVTLDRDFASGDMSIRLYEDACSNWMACSGKPLFSFGVPAGSGEAQVVRTDLGGKTIRTIRLYRNHGGGSTAEASYLKIEIKLAAYAKDFSTSHGWLYNESGVQPDGGVAEYPYANLGGSAYYMESAGHFTVPEGATVRVTLDRDFASGDMSIRLYEDACSNWVACSGKPLFSFGVPAGSGEAQVTRTDLGGKTIRTIRLYRNHGGGSTAEASYLKIEIEFP